MSDGVGVSKVLRCSSGLAVMNGAFVVGQPCEKRRHGLTKVSVDIRTKEDAI